MCCKRGDFLDCFPLDIPRALLHQGWRCVYVVGGGEGMIKARSLAQPPGPVGVRGMLGSQNLSPAHSQDA